MTLIDYAESKGIVLLREDVKFIMSRLQYMFKAQQAAILKRYVEIWVNAMAQCKNPAKRQNEGRNAANTWLREYNAPRHS